MKIEPVSNQSSFKAMVSGKFVKNAEKYYLRKMLPTQYAAFRNKLEQMEYFGDKNSVIMYACQESQNRRKHLLYLKNVNIDAKQGVILKATDKYYEILRYFNSLTAETIEKAEKFLAQK